MDSEKVLDYGGKRKLYIFICTPILKSFKEFSHREVTCSSIQLLTLVM